MLVKSPEPTRTDKLISRIRRSREVVLGGAPQLPLKDAVGELPDLDMGEGGKGCIPELKIEN